MEFKAKISKSTDKEVLKGNDANKIVNDGKASQIDSNAIIEDSHNENEDRRQLRKTRSREYFGQDN